MAAELHRLAPPVVSAHADSYAATNDATLTRNAAAGVLANDTDSAQHPLTVDQLNGAGGTAPFTDTSTKGAAVTLNADGSFTYDPTGSSTLQAIPRGQTTTDTFTYRANDGQGGTSNAATVTVTVTGHVNHPPVATADTASTDKQTPVKVTVLAQRQRSGSGCADGCVGRYDRDVGEGHDQPGQHDHL